MTDAYYVIETALLCALPFGFIAAGLLLRRKFSPAAAEGARPAPQGGARRALRFIGTFLAGCGIVGIVLLVVFIFNYLGKI